ncbi:MAG: hypothetical protein NTY84_12020 [Verrucomicrobia bacterium]|nr:hypothetical protein [Verrucomicrobiota bacterium]
MRTILEIRTTEWTRGFPGDQEHQRGPFLVHEPPFDGQLYDDDYFFQGEE